MLKKLLFSLFLGFFIAVSNVSAQKQHRIVGGKLAEPGQFMHHVSLQIIDGSCVRHVCGGSILDYIHIITAAHCVTDKFTRKSFGEPITIVAGTMDLRNESAGIYRDVKFIMIPASYGHNLPGQFYDDIAILRLNRPLPLGSDERIKAINLPADDNQYKPPNTQVAVVSGFGAYEQIWNPHTGKTQAGSNSPLLKFARGWINIVDNPPCTDKQVCFRNVNYHGSCQGDSGGALVDESKNTLIGIVSYSSHEVCGETTKFTRVSSHLEFIKKVRGGGLLDPNTITVIQEDLHNKQYIQHQPHRHCDKLAAE